MNAWFLIACVLGGSVLLSWPLGWYLKWAMDSEEGRGGVAQRFLTSLGGKWAREEQTWREYVVALLVMNVGMFVVVYGILAMQGFLPMNPDGKKGLEWSLMFHTACSFTTNTNLQHYSGEVSLSQFSQVFGLMWLQFVSAATGLAALVAIARSLAGRATVGNFFADVLRASVLVLLPLALIFACFFAFSGVPMTFEGAMKAMTLEGATQVISRGPVAAFLAIKQLGTNGGGYFGANSAHPFENPTAWTNLVSSVALIVIPMACVWAYGRVIGNMRHAAVIFGVMLSFLLMKMGGAVYFEQAATQAFRGLPIEQTVGNLEGKELRFGTSAAAVWAALTTCSSNGSVNAMLDSMNPLTGLVAMCGLWLNTTFGGVGVGMVNMLIYIVLAVFVAGMMIGRTPEYLGRRVEAREVKLAAVALLVHPFLILLGTAWFVATPWGRETMTHVGPHGFSQVLYEFSSAAANNGSGFEGLGDNTVAWNVATGLVMLVGRFVPIVLPFAIAGALGGKRQVAHSVGTLETNGVTFGFMLWMTIVFIGALTFLPTAMLGPVAEHVLMMK